MTVTFDTEANRYVTNSEIQTFKRCRRKWWLAYYRKLEAVRPEAAGVRRLGTRLHEALAEHYSSRGKDPIMVFMQGFADDYERARATFDAELEKTLEKDLALGRIMLEGYLEWVASEGMDSDLTVIADEDDIAVPINAEFKDGQGRVVNLLGKLDVRVQRHIDGAVGFLDHKSVGSFEAATKTLHMDEQMQMYLTLERLTNVAGTHIAGAWYNMLRRVKRTATAKPPFYHREFITFNPAQLQSFWERTVNTIIDILTLEHRLGIEGVDPRTIAYPSPRADCTWSCDFFLSCSMFDDGSAVERFIDVAFKTGDPIARYRSDEAQQKGESSE